MKPFTYNEIKDSSLEKEMNLLLSDISFEESPYMYGSNYVPRVTSILSDMLHEEYLMRWANYMGRIKHQDHTKHTERAADIGTIVHSTIEHYLKNDNISDTCFDEISDRFMRDSCHNAFLSFKRWWSIISQNQYRILMQEQPLVCKYYGGTLDALIEINSRTYIVDFKTSNHFNYKYYLQTSAYRRLLYYNYGIIVDGIIILRLSKDDVSFEEQVLDFSRQNDLMFIIDCERCFLSLVYAYYNRNIVQRKYSEFS